jgi:hypothetical protein
LAEVEVDSVEGTLYYWTSKLERLWAYESGAQKAEHLQAADQACQKAVAIAVKTPGLKWVTYQVLSAQLAHSRGDKPAAYERANSFLDNYRKLGLREAVNDESLRAVTLIAFRSSPDLKTQVELINKVRKEFSTEKDTGRAALVELLTQRIIGIATNLADGVWPTYSELCKEDSQTVMELAGKIGDPKIKAESEGRAWSAQGMVAFREYQEGSGEAKQGHLISAVEALQKATTLMSSDPESWTVRIVLGSLTTIFLRSLPETDPDFQKHRKAAEAALLAIPPERRSANVKTLLKRLQ